jgi:hypothetical protein
MCSVPSRWGALGETGRNQRWAAELLGMPLRILERKMQVLRRS